LSCQFPQDKTQITFVRLRLIGLVVIGELHFPPTSVFGNAFVIAAEVLVEDVAGLPVVEGLSVESPEVGRIAVAIFEVPGRKVQVRFATRFRDTPQLGKPLAHFHPPGPEMFQDVIGYHGIKLVILPGPGKYLQVVGHVYPLVVERYIVIDSVRDWVNPTAKIKNLHKLKPRTIEAEYPLITNLFELHVQTPKAKPDQALVTSFKPAVTN
jgi:hypothetical protein